jgi:hypothetical protein
VAAELLPDREAGTPLQVREIDVVDLRAVGGAQREDSRDVVLDEMDDPVITDMDAPQEVVGQLAAARRARISCGLVDGVQNARRSRLCGSLRISRCAAAL